MASRRSSTGRTIAYYNELLVTIGVHKLANPQPRQAMEDDNEQDWLCLTTLVMAARPSRMITMRVLLLLMDLDLLDRLVLGYRAGDCGPFVLTRKKGANAWHIQFSFP